MIIAFASTNGKNIDQHFGWSKEFYLYEVKEDNSSFLEVVDSSKEIEDEKEKLDYKIDSINRADILYCTQIGPTASKMVQSSKIHPVKVAENLSIKEAITNLQEMLKNNPPLWLLRILNKRS